MTAEMPNQRAPGQKPVLVMMKEEFLREIADGMSVAGYADRSQFVRDAIQEKLQKMGVLTVRDSAIAPIRLGKGGIAQVSSSGGVNIFRGQSGGGKYRLPAKKRCAKKKR